MSYIDKKEKIQKYFINLACIENLNINIKH